MAMSQLFLDVISAPNGTTYEVSTIRTLAGGSPDTKDGWSPFSMADFADFTAWPFETMVFLKDNRKGLYHEAHATEEDAKTGHARVVDMVRRGLEFPGETVSGPDGNPTLTPEQWALRTAPSGKDATKPGPRTARSSGMTRRSNHGQ